MRLSFDPALPINEHREEIARTVADHQVVVIAGETGSGKTTQLPKILHQMGRTSIAHTQPRRIAARSVAARIASECQVELGRQVGYAVRFDDQTSDDTVIALQTDGLLLAAIHDDRDLRRYDTIIIDEAHERSLAIDFLLGYLKRLLPRRPDLKVIITSATIDVDRFGEMFDAPILSVSGRTYPVEIRYRPLGDDDVLTGVTDAVEELPADGDILVFFSGEREIRDATEHLQSLALLRTEVLPLYGRLSAQDQQKIFQSHSGRRIVLATNVAETSITVPGIRYVIDPGLARISRYSQRLKVQRLPIEAISQASANQRAGRCGRVADGICIRLYGEDDFTGRPEFTDPEIRRTNLASVLLQMATLDLGSIDGFAFLDPPDSRAVRDGQALLTELGALRDGQLSRIGRTLARLPVDPRMGRMLIAADRLGCLADVLIIVAGLSIQDPRERPLGAEQRADALHARFREPDSDFISYLTLWNHLRDARKELSGNAFRKKCRAEHLHYLRWREWQDVHAQLRRTAKELKMKPGQHGSDPDLIHRALLPGLLSHIGRKDDDSREYSGARNSRFAIFPGSGLAKKPPAWIMAAELVETQRLWARTVAKVDPSWVEKAAGPLAKRSYAEPHWSAKRGAVMARERVTVYGVTVVADRLIGYSKIDPDLCRGLFIRRALVEGDWRSHHRFYADNARLLAEIADLEDRTRRRDLTVDDEAIYAFYDARIPSDVVTARHFDAWWKKKRQDRPDLLTLTRDDVLATDTDDSIDQDYPTSWTSESGSFDVSYVFEPGQADDGTWIDVAITELPDLDGKRFERGVPGRGEELVEALIRSLPKRLRRSFVPVPDHARKFAPRVRDSDDMRSDLARLLTGFSPEPVQAADFDWAAVPDHLKVGFRVLDEGKVVTRGRDVKALREELAPRLSKTLRGGAGDTERSAMKSWDVGTIEPSVDVRGLTGYPGLIDEGSTVGLRVHETPEEREAGHRRGVARLIALSTPTTVPRLLDGLSMTDRLLLATAPYDSPAALGEDCRIAAIEGLLTESGLPWDPVAYERVRDRSRGEIHARTERLLADSVRTLQAYGRLDLSRGDDATADVKVQVSWLIHPGFIREAGARWLPRLPHYLQAAQKRLTGREPSDLFAAQDLEARFAEITADMSPLRRLADDVAHVRWALEELRLSLLGHGVKTAFPVSVKRVAPMVDDLSRRRSGR